ncbi:hypothetical protein [Microbacterium paulum]
MITNPKAYRPFTCSSCYWYELPARADHGILPGGGILCRECLATYEGDVQILAPNRAAAVAALTARGFMTPAPSTEGARP